MIISLLWIYVPPSEHETRIHNIRCWLNAKNLLNNYKSKVCTCTCHNMATINSMFLCFDIWTQSWMHSWWLCINQSSIFQRCYEFCLSILNCKQVPYCYGEHWVCVSNLFWLHPLCASMTWSVCMQLIKSDQHWWPMQ